MKHLFPHIILCLFIIFLITGCREPSSGRLVVRKSTLPDSRTTQEWICIADSFRNIEQKDSALFYLKKAEQSLSEDVSVYQYYHIYRSLGELNQETFNPSSAKITEKDIDEKRLPVKFVLSEISKAKDSLMTPRDYIESAGYDNNKKLIGQAFEKYENMLKNADAMDFDDIIMNTVKLFRIDSEILGYFQKKFR